MAKFAAMMLRRGVGSRSTVADLVEAQAAERGAHAFVHFEGRAVSYAEINGLANRIAHWAFARGIGRGDAVALLLQNRPEFLAAWIGLAKIGATAALLNTSLTGRALAHVLTAGRARHVIAGVECLDNLLTLDPGCRETLSVHLMGDGDRRASDRTRAVVSAVATEDLDAALARFSPSNPPRTVRAGLRAGDDLFFIYTSGTTGLPKAARFSHSRFFGSCIHAFLSGFGPSDTMYCALPLYHTVGGVIAVSSVLTAGATLALGRRFSASRFWEEIAATHATATVYIGELCRYLLQQPAHPLERSHALQLAIGNGLRPDIWARFSDRFALARIVEFYGATEANVAMINFDGKVGSVGKPPFGLKRSVRMIRYDVDREQHVRDACGRAIPCAANEVGELVGRIAAGRTAAGRFEGYTSSDASEQKILRGVFEPGDAWFRSGDLLRFDEQGYFYFVDRIGDTFRWKGENVSTEEVAETLSGFPGVQLCAVYGVGVPGADGRAGMAALVLEGARRLDGEALYRFVAGALPAYAAPAFVRLKASLDVTGTLKLRKVELQREGFDPELVRDPLYVRDDRRGAYVPFDAETHRALQAGELRI